MDHQWCVNIANKAPLEYIPIVYFNLLNGCRASGLSSSRGRLSGLRAVYHYPAGTKADADVSWILSKRKERQEGCCDSLPLSPTHFLSANPALSPPPSLFLSCPFSLPLALFPSLVSAIHRDKTEASRLAVDPPDPSGLAARARQPHLSGRHVLHLCAD